MKTKVFRIVVIMMMLVTVLAGCNKNDTQSTSNLNQTKTIRIGDQGLYFPAKVAYIKGFFKEEFGDDFDISVSTFTNGPASIEALNANEIDFAFFGDLPAVVGNANNKNIKIISSLWNAEEGYYLIARNDSGINSLSDIKGKKIAFGAGTNSHKLILKFLKAVNLTENDVQLINLTSNTDAALIKGDVDLITGSQPTLDAVLEKVDGKVVETSKEYDSCIVVAVGNSDYMESNPDITARYLKVLDKTVKWMAENADEASQIVADFTNTEKADARKYYDTRTWEIGFSDDLNNILSDTLDFANKQNVITNGELDTLIDDSYIKTAGLQK